MRLVSPNSYVWAFAGQIIESPPASHWSSTRSRRSPRASFPPAERTTASRSAGGLALFAGVLAAVLFRRPAA